jgi:septum formation protein
MNLMEKRIYLASRSPRRRELLKQIGINFEVLIMRSFPSVRADVDETPRPGETPADYVTRIAANKAMTGWLRALERRLPRLPVLGADTTVAIDGEILGKPTHADDAAKMLRKLSGREHEVFSAVSVALNDNVETKLSCSRVRFAELNDALIQDYIDTGEPMDKAGAYGVQGKAAAFIAEIDGSYSGIMGLPLYETAQLLKQAGLSVL